jgi:hypothetical protein
MQIELRKLRAGRERSGRDGGQRRLNALGGLEVVAGACRSSRNSAFVDVARQFTEELR